jgi:hypothetical protein
MPRGRPRKSDQMLMRSAEFIGWALGGLEREIAHTRERLSSLTAQAARLRARVGASVRPSAGAERTAAPATRRRRRRQMSPEARKRMSDMMKKRWAERRKKNA